MSGRKQSGSLPERIRAILATRSLTLYQVAALSRLKYPHDPRYHLPRNLYFHLRTSGFTPTLHQISALSEISRYRLGDWLAVFGFRLDDISRLQVDLPKARTALLDHTLHDLRAAVPWFKARRERQPIPSVAPLSQLLESAGWQLVSSLLLPGGDPFLYAKIGKQDALAYPELLPGSIVRANPQLVAKLPDVSGNASTQIFLVEHRRGVCCCRLHQPAKNRITLVATQLPFADVEFQLTSEARILGVVDLEFRILTSNASATKAKYSLPEVPEELARCWKPGLLEERSQFGRPGSFVRDARLRAGLSLYRASEMSRVIANVLRDWRYFSSQAALSDYEVRDAPPRHIQKLFTLSILYCIRFGRLLQLFGFPSDTNAATIPDEWMPGPLKQPGGSTSERRTGFLEELFRRFGEPPLFLRDSLAALSGLPEISLHDIFWVGDQVKTLHVALRGAIFVVVNHRRRRPFIYPRKPSWEQPPYLLMKRDGTYVLAACSAENGTLILHPHDESFVRSERLRNHVDADVIGQIVAVVRSIAPSG